MALTLSKAVKAIDQEGILLVFPITNKKEPKSLWSHFFPRTKMRWEWDESGDNRVGDLWHLRAELSRSGRVVYAKWFQGRATFFSKKIYVDLLKILGATEPDSLILGPEAKQVLEALEMDSPLSTKELKEAVDLKGRFYEPQYNRALKELWRRLLIVGYGEKEDGAFPSLAMGASKNIFEELYLEAKSKPLEAAREGIDGVAGEGSPFGKFLNRVLGE